MTIDWNIVGQVLIASSLAYMAKTLLSVTELTAVLETRVNEHERRLNVLDEAA